MNRLIDMIEKLIEFSELDDVFYFLLLVFAMMIIFQLIRVII